MADAPAQLVNGATRLIGIIGNPIAQAKSPAVWNARFAAAGVNAAMVPLSAAAGDFDGCMRGLKTLTNMDGIVVTLPFKNAVAEHVDLVLPAAKRTGAINAMRREAAGRWSGDIFDGQGFVGGLRASGCEPKGQRVMLLGAGGAGSAIADSLAEAGAAELTVFDKTLAKAEKLAAMINEAHPHCRAQAGAPALSGKTLLVNATPAGMKPGDGLPFAVDAIDKSLFVADIVPRPDATPLLTLARRSGCRTMSGEAMVAGQVNALFEFFGLKA
ncbi:MAG: shikimate dehydrogenase [Pseudolabrys sp.]|jgi:shikimate dehydrogenase|nr:shikimate dehydrogenase [Pseudolabrys sp.]